MKSDEIFYLTQAAELEKYRALCQAKGEADVPLFIVLEHLAGGDKHLLGAMWAFVNFAHAFDDLLDEQPGWSAGRKELAMKALHDFVCTLLLNPLVRENTAEFRCIFTQTILRAIDGDAMAQSPDPARKALAPAVRCGDVDALIHMVYLAHGWAAAKDFSARRDYDLPDQTKTAPARDERTEVG